MATLKKQIAPPFPQIIGYDLKQDLKAIAISPNKDAVIVGGRDSMVISFL